MLAFLPLTEREASGMGTNAGLSRFYRLIEHAHPQDEQAAKGKSDSPSYWQKQSCLL